MLSYIMAPDQGLTFADIKMGSSFANLSIIVSALMLCFYPLSPIASTMLRNFSWWLGDCGWRNDFDKHTQVIGRDTKILGDFVDNGYCLIRHRGSFNLYVITGDGMKKERVLLINTLLLFWF